MKLRHNLKDCSSLWRHIVYADWFVPLLIYGSSLYYSLLVTLRKFEIIADSAREYQTFLVYVEQGYWTPLVDNILSTSLWTTYVPALAQRVLNFVDPAIAYRLVLALLVAPFPLLIYLLVRRYTSTTIAIALSVVAFTSFYYQGNVEYARMLVALEFVVGLLIVAQWRGKIRWLLLAPLTIGLVTAHYTTTYLWLMLFAGTVLTMAVYSAFHRRLLPNTLVIVSVVILLWLGTWAWYNNHSETSVVPYASSIVETAQTEIQNPSDIVSTWAERAASGHPSALLDMVMAKSLLGLRVIMSGVVLFMLWRHGKLWSVMGILSAGRVIGLGLAAVLPGIEDTIGLLRIGFMVLPVELLLVAYWWGKNRDDTLLLPLLGAASIVYH